MDEKDLIHAVALECGLSMIQTDKVLNSLASNIQIALKNQGSVTLKGLGTFTTSVQSKIAESNSITGETIRYSNTHVPEFQPVKELLTLVEDRLSLD